MTRQMLAIFVFLAISYVNRSDAQDPPYDASSRERQCPRAVRAYCGEWTVREVNYSDNALLTKANQLEQAAQQHMKVDDEFEIVARGRRDDLELWLVPEGALDRQRWRGQARRLTVIGDGTDQRCLATKIEINVAGHQHADQKDWHQLTLLWNQRRTRLYFHWTAANDDSEPTQCIFTNSSDLIDTFGRNYNQRFFLLAGNPLHGGRAHAN